LITYVSLVSTLSMVTCLKDPSDGFVLELAVESECDFIVTHNIKDFKNINKFNLKAITPQELLRNIGEIT